VTFFFFVETNANQVEDSLELETAVIEAMMSNRLQAKIDQVRPIFKETCDRMVGK